RNKVRSPRYARAGSSATAPTRSSPRLSAVIRRRHARREPLWRRWRVLAVRVAVLAYLFFVADAVMQNSRGVGATAGYVIIATFAVCWLVTTPVPAPLRIPPVPARRFWVLYAVLAGLFAAELPFAHAGAFVM